MSYGWTICMTVYQAALDRAGYQPYFKERLASRQAANDGLQLLGCIGPRL